MRQRKEDLHKYAYDTNHPAATAPALLDLDDDRSIDGCAEALAREVPLQDVRHRLEVLQARPSESRVLSPTSECRGERPRVADKVKRLPRFVITGQLLGSHSAVAAFRGRVRNCRAFRSDHAMELIRRATTERRLPGTRPAW